MQSITLTITGRFIAKKNSRQMKQNRRTKKLFSAPSEAFESYHDDAIRQIRKQLRGGEGNLRASIAAPRKLYEVDPPYRVDYFFGVKGKGRIDVDNAMASINDILQDAGVIDDDLNVIWGSFVKSMGKEEWFTKVKITHVGVDAVKLLNLSCYF